MFPAQSLFFHLAGTGGDDALESELSAVSAIFYNTSQDQEHRSQRAAL